MDPTPGQHYQPYISPHSFFPYPPPGQQHPGTFLHPTHMGYMPGQLPPQQAATTPMSVGGHADETEETDSEGGGKNTSNPSYKCKPRRKATQKPVGSDQKRQAFSKRKRGIVLKAYQLYKLTDAKVFLFMVNDKGSSWAYASPSFGSSLRPEHLKHMRELADLPHTPKHVTEVMAHPKLDETDRHADNRHLYLTSVSAQDNLHLVSSSVPASLPYLPAPPLRASSGSSHIHESMLPHMGQQHVHPHPHHLHHQQPHLPEHYLSSPPQHLHQVQPAHMHMHPQAPHQLYPLQQTQHQQLQQQQQQSQSSNPTQMQLVPFTATANAATPNNSSHSIEKPGTEQPQQQQQQQQQAPGTSSSINQKASQPGKSSSPKQADAAQSEPQQQQAVASSGKDGSDEPVMITASSANLNDLTKPEVELEGVQSNPGDLPQDSTPQQQHSQQHQQQPKQPHQSKQEQQQQLPSMYAGRVIADPAGNLYRVVHDQLVPLMPHELDPSLSNSCGPQSPGLAALAAAAAAAVHGNGPPSLSALSGGEAAAGNLHLQPPNPNGSLYGMPPGYPGQHPYLMMPQHMPYGSLPFQVSQPYMDSMGYSLPQGMSMPYHSTPYSMPMSYMASQPMG